ncbi:uncharacterized protein [Clytia hemisphaerica]|uniref:uncharacterized protein isoform X1 n=1 Tax=Clytia hemisphaerica TaxID=252671 RepID=UPI0034D6B20E
MLSKRKATIVSYLLELLMEEEVPGTDTQKPGKLLRCPQEGCGKVFRSSPGYRYHLKSHDIDPRPHVCHVCHKKFKSANGLKYHLRKAHHIEPVASKQNNNNNNGNANSPKDRESLSSEEDHLFNMNEYNSRGYVNGGGGSFSSDRTSSIAPSPLTKSLSSPLIKNIPLSPLLKSPLDFTQYLSTSSSGSGSQSPYPVKDRYGNFFDRRNDFTRKYGTDDFTQRGSLSEYTQQCHQNNMEFRNQCQRLSTGDLSNPRLPSVDFQSQRSFDYFDRRPDGGFHSPHPGHHGVYNNFNNHKNPADELQYTSLNDVKPSTLHGGGRLFSPFKDLVPPNEAKEYPNSLINSHPHNMPCVSTNNNNSCSYQDNPYSNSLNLPTVAKSQCHLSQNTEQIVPDISSPGCQLSPPAYDRNNNNHITNVKRGTSESSIDSDSVFQNENSVISPVPTSTLSPVLPSPDIIKKLRMDSITDTKEPYFPVSSMESILQSPKSLLTRRTSRSKSIPPALVINPNPSSMEIDSKGKDVGVKKDQASKLRQLAEFATSPRSLYNHSPLTSLTPSLLGTDGSGVEWGLKSPSKFSFSDKSFLLTPTVHRQSVGSESHPTSGSDSIITSTHPVSPYNIHNIQTPSYWQPQIWPTPVWLCFLKGCHVKFEQDDLNFRTSEEVADYCTTPGGRKRDNMNFYTSGMKIVCIKMEQSMNSAREMVVLTFEQIIPGTQRLVAKCPSDHPFYVKHKGWVASSPTEAMARYGTSFRALAVADTVIPSPSSNNKLIATPSNTLSPLVKSSVAEVFTFNTNETKMFTQATKIVKTEPPSSSSTAAFMAPKLPPPPPPTTLNLSSIVTQPKPPHSTASSTSSPSSSSTVETITLTFSSKASEQDSNSSTAKLVNEYKNLMTKDKTNRDPEFNKSLSDSESSPSVSVETNALGGGGIRKKRRKPLTGEEKDRRPMNGFMLFAKSMRVELTKEFPGKDNRAISKLLGERWRESSEEKREEFARSAKEMADERMKVNPDCWKRKHKKDPKDGAQMSVVSPLGAQKMEQNNNTMLTNNNDVEFDVPSQIKKIKLEEPDEMVYSPMEDENSMTPTNSPPPSRSITPKEEEQEIPLQT